MSGTGEQQSPFGPGFVAACIVIGAVLLCGGLVLISGQASSDPTAAPGSTQQRAGGNAELRGGVGSAAGAPSVGRSQGSTGCNRVAVDQAVPQQPPVVDSWEVSRRIVVPRSSMFGPAVTDPDGFRRCFAHSPTGAVFAAYSAYAAMADQGEVVGTARKLMVPGPATDALIRELQADTSASGYSVPQLAGYRVIDAGPDRVSLMLATPVDSDYMSLTLTLVWYGGDWRLQPPKDGEPVGAPFAQHRDLSDFVAWSGA